jgi:ribosomal protein S27AE
MKSSPQISLLQTTRDISQNNIIVEKKLDFGKNAFIVWQKKYPDFRFACPKCGTLDEYPDFRFACPKCGTLDVLIDCNHFDTLKGYCLDCKTEWIEDGKQ